METVQQRELTHRAARQFEHLLDHNLAQAQVDGLVHYHQGLVSQQVLHTPRMSDLAIDAMLHTSETAMSKLLVDEVSRYVPDVNRALDAGCGKLGTGVIFVRKNPQAELWGVDVSRSSIDFSKRDKNVLSDPNHYRLFCNDFLTMEFEDQSFQVIYALESLQYCIQLRNLFRKWRKMISDRGMVTIAQMVIDPDNPQADLARTVQGITENMASVMHSQRSIVELLNENQFEVVEVKDLTNDVINYWRLRNRWGMKTEMDAKIMEGYCAGHLQYKLFLARPVPPTML